MIKSVVVEERKILSFSTCCFFYISHSSEKDNQSHIIIHILFFTIENLQYNNLLLQFIQHEMNILKRHCLSSVKQYPWLWRYVIGLKNKKIKQTTCDSYNHWFFTLQCTVPHVYMWVSSNCPVFYCWENVGQIYCFIITLAIFICKNKNMKNL